MELQAIADETVAIIGRSSIRYVNQRGPVRPGMLTIHYPFDYAWLKAEPDLASSIGKVARRFDDWLALVKPAFSRESNQSVVAFEQETARVRIWVARDRDNYQLPGTVSEAKRAFMEQIRKLGALVSELFPAAANSTTLVPDTNWLLNHPDLLTYGNYSDTIECEVRLMPTVLGELDGLKARARDGDVRKRARDVLRNLRSARLKGSLATGVRLAPTLILSTEAREPQDADVPAWLDFNVPDDRLLASALHAQLAMPQADVLLLTDDFNLQNKAEMAGMPFQETAEDGVTDD